MDTTSGLLSLVSGRRRRGCTRATSTCSWSAAPSGGGFCTRSLQRPGSHRAPSPAPIRPSTDPKQSSARHSHCVSTAMSLASLRWPRWRTVWCCRTASATPGRGVGAPRPSSIGRLVSSFPRLSPRVLWSPNVSRAPGSIPHNPHRGHFGHGYTEQLVGVLGAGRRHWPSTPTSGSFTGWHRAAPVGDRAPRGRGRAVGPRARLRRRSRGRDAGGGDAGLLDRRLRAPRSSRPLQSRRSTPARRGAPQR